MWRNGVYMQVLPDGGFLFSVWEPATIPQVGLPSHCVLIYRDEVPWGAVQTRNHTLPLDEASCYDAIIQQFPAAADGIRKGGNILLTLAP